MRTRQLALTGPIGAAVHGLDGFRDLDWPSMWCAPRGGVVGDHIVQTRHWEPPVLVNDVLVCPVPVVLRHLNARPADLVGRPDRLAPRDRVELALEHALRLQHPVAAAGGGRSPGDAMLRAQLIQRGNEPATESFAETRALQLLRSWGLEPWRQVPIQRDGVIVYRADFMLPFARRARPVVFTPRDGVLLEVDSRERHEDNFEHDQFRNATYTELGFHWISFMPRQIERHRPFVRRALEGAFVRAGHTLT